GFDELARWREVDAETLRALGGADPDGAEDRARDDRIPDQHDDRGEEPGAGPVVEQAPGITDRAEADERPPGLASRDVAEGVEFRVAHAHQKLPRTVDKEPERRSHDLNTSPVSRIDPGTPPRRTAIGFRLPCLSSARNARVTGIPACKEGGDGNGD